MRPAEGGTASALRVWIARGCGVGSFPVAPGTAGALVGVALFALTRLAGPAAPVLVWLAVTGIGLWSAGAAERALGCRDPGSVVIDEIAGQLLALLLLPPTARNLLLGFVAFRLFDVAKPFPLRRLERLPGASGIMADDLMAGLYANGTVRLLSVVLAALVGSP